MNSNKIFIAFWMLCYTLYLFIILCLQNVKSVLLVLLLELNVSGEVVGTPACPRGPIFDSWPGAAVCRLIHRLWLCLQTNVASMAKYYGLRTLYSSTCAAGARISQFFFFSLRSKCCVFDKVRWNTIRNTEARSKVYTVRMFRISDFCYFIYCVWL
jgi:hypothetical protein